MQCPQCGTAMNANPAPDRRKMIKQMVDAGSSAHYATNFVDSHLEKEKAAGVVYTCPGCRYVSREAEGKKSRKRDEAA